MSLVEWDMAKFKNNFVLMFLFWFLSGCHPGIDYAALPLNPNDFVDYGDRVKNKKIPPGPLAYGLVKRGVLESGISHFNEELVSIAQALETIRNLPSKTIFNSSQVGELNKFIFELQKIIDERIKPKVLNATLSASSAVELSIEIEKNITHKGIVPSLCDTVRQDIPQPVLGQFDIAQKSLKVAFERMYQLSVLYSQALVQEKANKLINRLKILLGQLQESAREHVMFVKHSQAHDANLALLATSGKAEALSRFASLMTTKDKVKKGLIESIGELKTSLFGVNGLKTRFIDKVMKAYHTSALASFEQTQKAFEELEFVINDYDESPKSSAESLQNLNDGAFSGQVSAVLESVSPSEDTDLVRFMRLLSQHKVMGLRADEASEAFIQSLAVALVHRIAENYGVHIDNVYGLNFVKLNETKASFKMSETAWADYLKGICRKIFDTQTNNNQFAHLFVLFADQFAPGAPITDLVDIFSQGKSRVIVVAHRPMDFNAEETYRSSGLDLISALEVCTALVRAHNPKLNAPVLAESLVKPMFAFKAAPEKFNLVSVEIILRDVLARLSGKNDPSILDVNEAIVHALGASKEAYDVNLITNSSVLVDTLKTVEEKIKEDSAYYFKESRGLKGAFREGEHKRFAEIRKLQEVSIDILRREEAKQIRKNIRAQIKDSRQRLREIQEDLDPNPALSIVRTARRNLISEIDKLLRLYGRKIDLLYNLSIAEQEIFENAPDNHFKAYFKKIKEIIGQKNYFQNLKNLAITQITLRTDAEIYLPPEILTMLDRYPLWHPSAYFGAATGRVFIQQFGGRLATDPSLLTDVDNFYSGLPQFEALPAGPHAIKTKIIREFGPLRDLANAVVAPNPPPATALLALQALPAGYHNLPAPLPLKNVRFEMGTIAEVYLAQESDGVKTLSLFWDDFLNISTSIQRSAGRIYQHLLNVKKS